MKTVHDGIFMAVLLWCSKKDIHQKEIATGAVIAGILYGFFDQILLQKTDFVQIMIGLLPGLCFLALSLLADGAIGFGDGLVICMGGLFYPLQSVLYWLFYAFSLSALWGGVLILRKKGGRKTELAFVPFLTLAAFLVCLTGDRI